MSSGSVPHRPDVKHISLSHFTNEAGLTDLQKVKQQRCRDVGQRLHVEHLSQPSPAVVQTVRDTLKHEEDQRGSLEHEAIRCKDPETR